MQCLNKPSALHRLLAWRHSHSRTNLFVGGLSYDTNEPVLKDAFKKYGEIIEVKVICDRMSGKSRGYGFVHYSSEVAAINALMEMNGQLVEGRNIIVRYASADGKRHANSANSNANPNFTSLSD